MKTILKFAVLLNFIGILAVSCSGQQGEQASETVTREHITTAPVQSSYTQLDPQQFDASLKASTNALLIDVRTPQEFEQGVISGAQNVNFYDEDFRNQLAALDLSHPVYIYCRSGNRSGKSVPVLQELGASQIIELKGGVINWQNNGMPLDDAE